MHVYTCIHVYMYISYIYIYIHIHIHTHTHMIHVLLQLLQRAGAVVGRQPLGAPDAARLQELL